METLLYFLGFVFLLCTYFYVTTTAVTIGVRAGMETFAQEFLPLYLATLERLEDDTDPDVLTVLQAEENGEISSEAAATILKNMRGEK
jgi:hypothetical protein